MARFPTREADVAALAGTIAFGLADNAEDFPDTPVSVEVLQESIARYNRAKEITASAQGAAAEAFEEKQDAVQDLTDKMKNLGWSGRRDPVALQPPGVPRTLEVKREGKGWVYLDWKTPAEGGAVSAYRVFSRTIGEVEWKQLVLSFESMTYRPRSRERHAKGSCGRLRKAIKCISRECF